MIYIVKKVEALKPSLIGVMGGPGISLRNAMKGLEEA